MFKKEKAFIMYDLVFLLIISILFINMFSKSESNNIYFFKKIYIKSKQEQKLKCSSYINYKVCNYE